MSGAPALTDRRWPRRPCNCFPIRGCVRGSFFAGHAGEMNQAQALVIVAAELKLFRGQVAAAVRCG